MPSSILEILGPPKAKVKWRDKCEDDLQCKGGMTRNVVIVLRGEERRDWF